MDPQWEELIRRIQEENDLLLDEIERLLEERDEAIRALEQKILLLEQQLKSRMPRSGDSAVPPGGQNPAEGRAALSQDSGGRAEIHLGEEGARGYPGGEELPGFTARVSLSMEEWAKRSGRGVGEVQLMAALAERRRRRAIGTQSNQKTATPDCNG
ncbi:hypothetical protein [Kyrpidia spormannii]|uniref:Uncharacterized protein n=1 Tax=Kyrpidia spormannii TaxID=2055160 RepID=A0ACA8Z9D2_9BACL|nr:hypothetical protein [Kyrpidia spormannii]CAB3392460.1 conserved protein of unknown function [Kyrpidia spormannii]